MGDSALPVQLGELSDFQRPIREQHISTVAHELTLLWEGCYGEEVGVPTKTGAPHMEPPKMGGSCVSLLHTKGVNSRKHKGTKVMEDWSYMVSRWLASTPTRELKQGSHTHLGSGMLGGGEATDGCVVFRDSFWSPGRYPRNLR